MKEGTRWKRERLQRRREKSFGVKGRKGRGNLEGEDGEEGKDKGKKEKNYEMYIGLMIRKKIEEMKKKRVEHCNVNRV